MNGIPPKIPPPIPPAVPPPPPAPQPIYIIQQAPRKSSAGRVIRMLFGVFLFGIVAIAIVTAFIAADHASSSAPSAGSISTYVPSPKEQARSKVRIQNWTWERENEAFMTATFTITNASKFDIKDIEIKCTHFGNSGTVIDSNTRTIYEIIPACHARTFANFDMGFIHSQATSSSAIVEDFTVIEK